MPKLIETLSDQQIGELVELYERNVSLREIEKQTSFSRQAVAKLLEELGVKTTSGNHYRKYFFNFDFFERVDNELTAYWLGFFYADGCILSQGKYGEQDIKLAISERDLELLEKFKQDIQSTYPIRYDYSKQNPLVLQSLRSSKAANDLKRLGCVERKSLILQFPSESQVPKKYIHHFIRGYFDGDGSVSSYQRGHHLDYHICFVGTEQFIKELYNFFQMGSVFPDKRKTNSWYLGINGNLQVEKAYHMMYDGATRYMERKYVKFQELFKQNESSGI